MATAKKSYLEILVKLSWIFHETERMTFNRKSLRRAKHGYMAVIGQDAYEMSADANMPNGVCIYSGNVDADSDLAYYIKSLPSADEVIKQGDQVYLVASREFMDELGEMFAQPQRPARSVVILGGGLVGFRVAEGLQGQGVLVKVIEKNIDDDGF